MRPTLLKMGYYFSPFYKRSSLKKIKNQIDTKIKSYKNVYNQELELLKSESTIIDLDKEFYSVNLFTEDFKINHKTYFNEIVSEFNNFNFTNARKLTQLSTIKLNSDFDKAYLYYLYAQIYLETGNLKEAIFHFNNCTSLFEKLLSLLHPITISCRMDSLSASIKVAKNISNYKNQAIEEIAKAKLINNNFLISKGYNLLAYIYSCNYMYKTAKLLNNLSIDIYKKNNLSSDRLLYLISKNPSLLDSNSIKKLMKLKYNNKEISNTLLFNQLNIKENHNFYEDTKNLDSILENSTNQLLKIKSYVMKYILYETNERPAVSNYYLEKAFENLENNYTKDSHDYIEYYSRVLYENFNKSLDKSKLEKSVNDLNEFLIKNNLNNTNIYQLGLIYNKLLFAIMYNEGIHEVTKRYGEFFNIHKNLIGDQSEFLFDLNILMRFKGYSSIYKSFLDRNK